MKQVVSPDISVIDVNVLLDISTATTSMTLTNASTQTNPANLHWVFEIYSPSGVPIHKGDFTSPDRTNWTAPYIQNSGFPKPLNSIEWGNYKIIVKVKDSQNTIFEHDPIIISLCRPNGNDKSSKNTYGTAKASIITQCREARLYAEDRTNYTYQGGTGTAVSKNFILIYPPNDQGQIPANFEINQFSSASIPISQSGSGYQYFITSVIDYSLDDIVTVRVKYIFRDVLTVYCNIDLSPIFYEVQKLLSDIETGSTKDAAKAKDTLAIVSAKLLMANIAMLNPEANGINPFELIDEINALTGWGCDCCTSAINPLSSLSISNNTTYELVSDGGDITGDIEQIAGGIRIHVGDYTYSFNMCPTNSSTAFTVTPSISGRNKNFCLNVNTATLATDLLNVIKSNTTLLNTFTSMVGVQSGSYSININGRCVIPSETVCDYTFSSINLNAGEKFLIKNILFSNGQRVIANFYYDGTNESQLSAALNTLGIGTWGSTFVGGKLNIITNGNDLSFDTIEYDYINSSNTAISVNQRMLVTKDCTPETSKDLNVILQGIVDYVCDFFLSKIKTGKAYTIKYIQAIGGNVDPIDIAADKDASYLLDKIVYSFNSLVDVVRNTKEATCTNVRGLFNAATTMTDNTILYGGDNANCFSYTAKQLALKVMQFGQTDPDVQAVMCQAVQNCASPVCDPVTSATVSLNSGTLLATITNTGASQYKAYYYNMRTPDQPSLVQTVNAVTGATTPISWSSIPIGQYAVVINAICANGKVSADKIVFTVSCAKPGAVNVSDTGTAFSVTWSTLPVNAAKVRIHIDYPNGGTFENDYNISPATISINKPAGVYGAFVFRAYTVCDVSAGFISDPSNAVSLNVAAPPACPSATGLEITALAYNQASFKIVKPVGGTTPNAYTLRLIPQDGGSPIINTVNMGGSVVTWTNVPLSANMIYSWEVMSECLAGQGNPVNGGTFITPPNTSNNSSITNNTATAATPAQVMINGSLVLVVNPLNSGATSNFVSPNYVAAEVKLRACNAGAISATLTSNSVVYTGVQDTTDLQLFIFTNVNITGGYQVQFDD
jgi:hypothetical protein